MLIITGEHDRATTPRAAREMHAGIPGSRLCILQDAGHMGFVEQPEAYLREVRKFLGQAPM